MTVMSFLFFEALIATLTRPFTAGSLLLTLLSTDQLPTGVGMLWGHLVYLCLRSPLPSLTLALEADSALTLIQESPEVASQF